MKVSTPIFNIAMVDDHKMFRSGIAALLNEYADIHILFEANNGIELQKKNCHISRYASNINGYKYAPNEWLYFYSMG
jgi:hypothetical protein